ncbi:MAG: hypothetical protein HUK22_03045, partial [Thermoguttaceae bacterium]|nr:hypothetical protein [Thermoguttaceae bacterium]
MKFKRLLTALAIFLAGAPFLCARAADVSPLVPANLRCEYLTNPKGLDVKAPRFSWILESNVAAIGQAQ